MFATLSSSVMKEHKVLISASVLKMNVKILNMVQHVLKMSVKVLNMVKHVLKMKVKVLNMVQRVLKMDADVPPLGDPVTLQAVENEWISSNKMCQNLEFFGLTRL